jgi:hypothetical protein
MIIVVHLLLFLVFKHVSEGKETRSIFILLETIKKVHFLLETI